MRTKVLVVQLLFKRKCVFFGVLCLLIFLSLTSKAKTCDALLEPIPRLKAELQTDVEEYWGYDLETKKRVLYRDIQAHYIGTQFYYNALRAYKPDTGVYEIVLDFNLYDPFSGHKAPESGAVVFQRVMNSFALRKVVAPNRVSAGLNRALSFNSKYTLKAIWTESSLNYKIFKKAVSDGFSISEAARMTWTGTQAQKYGLTHLSFEEITLENAELLDNVVIVKFSNFKLL